jgi:putative SOS response-associated peptidase YedK
MCGRYTLYTEKEVLARRFEVEIAELSPSYNVAPTQSVISITFEKEARVAGAMRWGLIPFWTKDETKLPQMINARVESVATRPAYREAFRRRRCLILADGFYEWQRGLGPGKRKIPHWIFREDGGPFAMAGIWSVWRRPDLERKWLRSCAIITTSANAAVSELHDRMPVILPRKAESAWLDPALDGNTEELTKLLVPIAPEELRSRPISTRVNSAGNDDPSLIEFCDEDPQLGFF